MAAHLPASLVIVGAGKMGSAMLDGWLALGLKPAKVVAVDPGLSDDAREALGEKGISIAASTQDVRQPEVLVLAIKPQMLDAAALSLASTDWPADTGHFGSGWQNHCRSAGTLSGGAGGGAGHAEYAGGSGPGYYGAGCKSGCHGCTTCDG